jgi:sec-independent protein translocase protein TatA
MGAFSFWHLLILVLVVVVLFGGRGRISDLMGDIAKGVKSFKKGISEDPDAKPGDPVKTIEHDGSKTVETPREAVKSKLEG